MEFLRFGSSIPGTYWGCCAVDIIQKFKVDPDDKAAIQLVSGDGGGALLKDNEELFAGQTYREIFETRLRIGTFSQTNMPNHGFIAIMTASQISGGVGKKWLEILKANGFEFLRAVDNSVYTGDSVPKTDKFGSVSSHVNYIFGLFRNVGSGAIENQFLPPKQWTDLPDVVDEAYKYVPGESLTLNQMQWWREKWHSAKTKLFKRSELAKDTPIWLAGIRNKRPQELEVNRPKTEAKASPWAAAA